MLQAMLEFVFEAVIRVLLAATGHFILWICTLGRWQLFEDRYELASITGGLFYVLVGVVVWLVFFR